MPFTPFHFGIGIFFFGLLPVLDPLALFIGVVAPDIEGIISLFVLPRLNLPLHGLLHTFFAAIMAGLIIGTGSYLVLKTTVGQTSSKIKISLKLSLTSGLLGTLSHIILDAPLYPEMNPFFPVLGNPLYEIVPSAVPYEVCMLAFLIGAVLITIRFLLMKGKEKKTLE